MQSAFNTHAAPDEVWSSGGGYNGGSFPSIANPSGDDVQQYTFYDQYDFRNALAPSFVFNNSLAYHSPYGNAKGLQTGSVSYHSDNHNRYNLSVSFFDNKSREIQSIESHVKSVANNANPIITSTKYNFAGEEIESRTNAQFAAPVGTQSQTLKTDRDHVGRPTALFLSQNGSAFEQIMQLSYDAIGRNTQKKFMPNGTYIFGGTPDYITRPPSPATGTVDIAKKAIFLLPTTTITPNYLGYIDPNASGGTSISGLQTMDFSWHIRGNMRGINLDANGNPNPNSVQGDLFASKLDFETENQFSGNIGKQTWTNLNASNQAETRSFTYNYDNANRLRNSVFSGLPNENYGLKDLSYDKNGNIAFVKRYGNIGSNFGLVDNLTYIYQGNKLTDVADAISGNPTVKDFRAANSSLDYTYYSNGALKSDLNKGINNLIYNTYVNKIAGVEMTTNRTLNIVYDGQGELLKRTSSDGTIWENVRGYVFKNNALYASDIPDGRIVFENSQSHLEFNYRDIFGNLRVGFNGKNSTLSKVQQADYDAFGWVFNETAATSQNLKKYQNQPRIEEFDLNLDIFRFRASDPTIGRLVNVDPLAEKYAYNSVYALQENKFGMGVELEGKELLPWHQEQTPIVVRPSNVREGMKTDVSSSSSIGIQFGAEAKLLGFPVGLSFDLGSIKLSDFSISDQNNKTSVTNNISDGYSTTKGYSIGIVLAGFEKKTTTTVNQDGSKSISKETSINILGVTEKNASITTIDVRGNVNNNKTGTIEVGQTSAKGKFGYNIGISATISTPKMSEIKVNNYSSTDNTRVDKHFINKLIKKDD